MSDKYDVFLPTLIALRHDYLRKSPQYNFGIGSERQIQDKRDFLRIVLEHHPFWNDSKIVNETSRLWLATEHFKTENMHAAEIVLKREGYIQDVKEGGERNEDSRDRQIGKQEADLHV